MKNFLTAFIIFIIWSFFGLWLYSWLHTTNSKTISFTPKTSISDTLKETTKPKINQDNIQKLNAKLDTSIQEQPILDKKNTLRILDQHGDIIFTFSKGISTFKNTNQLVINDSIQEFKNIIHNYLEEHPQNEIHIKSFYSPLEDIGNSNFGIKRGNKMKENLEEFGVSSEKIVVKPIIKNVTFSETKSFKNCISFIFKPLDHSRIESLKVLKKITKIIYPTFSENGILANKALYKVLEEIKVLKNKHPELKVQIVGHTDNIGNQIDNYKVGLKYAQQVRWFLLAKSNLERKQIVAISKGESEPLDSNKTKQGRKNNRRIEVIIE